VGPCSTPRHLRRPLRRLKQAQVINPGEPLKLECHWNNTGPGAVDTNSGEGTNDEMCMSFLHVTQERGGPAPAARECPALRTAGAWVWYW
jgi:hypothetical protein